MPFLLFFIVPTVVIDPTFFCQTSRYSQHLNQISNCEIPVHPGISKRKECEEMNPYPDKLLLCFLWRCGILIQTSVERNGEEKYYGCEHYREYPANKPHVSCIFFILLSLLLCWGQLSGFRLRLKLVAAVLTMTVHLHFLCFGLRTAERERGR